MTHRTSESKAGTASYDSPPFDVSVRSDDPLAWVVEVRGELDLATGPMLKQHMEPYNNPSEDDGHLRRVVYLLPGLEFIDATGLRALLDAADGRGPETITVREPSSVVCRLLELVGFDSMIEEPANR